MLAIIIFIVSFIVILISGYNIIKKDKKPYILLGIAIFINAFTGPFVINNMYKIGYDIKNPYITLWQAKDMLSFYGSLLAFLGTIFLGGLTLLQNNRLNEINKSLTKKQYEPILTSLPMDLNNLQENNYTWVRLIEQNSEDTIVNNGYTSRLIEGERLGLGIRNMGLGVAINICTSMYELVSVEGLDDLEDILIYNVDDFMIRLILKIINTWKKAK